MPRHKEILRYARHHREHVVIEVDIFLVKSADSVKVHLYGRAVEDRKVLRRDYVLVCHYIDLVRINPGRDLALRGNHQMHPADERHVYIYAPEQELQRPPVSETLRKEIVHSDGRGILSLPLRIQPVNVCYHCIHMLL